ncbi:MAG: rhombosortase [Lacunisphaera sp.]
MILSPRLRRLLAKPPWFFLGGTLLALIIQLNPSWRGTLLYDRTGLARGEYWRIWTGHLVHFGWPHFIADVGLFFILGWLLESQRPVFSRISLLLMPLFISGAIYCFDPAMQRYGGLSAVNLGLLLYLAAQGWRRDWTDWFWPAVLAVYVGEVIFESVHGGRGGGMIRFDDAEVHVATGAHLASAGYALLAWLGAVAFEKFRSNPDQGSRSI